MFKYVSLSSRFGLPGLVVICEQSDNAKVSPIVAGLVCITVVLQRGVLLRRLSRARFAWLGRKLAHYHATCVITKKTDGGSRNLPADRCSKPSKSWEECKGKLCVSM
jgi:hypothetical protein